MADLTQTAANVGIKSKTIGTQILQAGEGIVQGQPLYKKAADGKAWLADADTLAEATGIGISLTSCATDEYVLFAKTGDVDLGATLAVATTYVISTNVGKIAPIGDLTTGDYVSILGTASTTATLKMSIDNTGQVKP